MSKPYPYLTDQDERMLCLIEEIRQVAVDAAVDCVEIKDTHQWRMADEQGCTPYKAAMWFAHKWLQANGVHPPEDEGTEIVFVERVPVVEEVA